MEVTRYKVNAKCYPRYKAATSRLSDISRRTYSLWNSTFGETFPTNALDEEIENDTQNDCLDLLLFDRKGAKQISYTHGTDMLLHNQGISHQDSYQCENADTFLKGNQHLLKSTSVLIFRDHRCLKKEIKNVSTQHNIVIVSSKRKRNRLAKANAQRINLKVSTDENIAADIGLLLEITVFKPLWLKFDIIKRVILPKQKASDLTETGHSSGLHLTRRRTGTKRKHEDSTNNWTGNQSENNGRIQRRNHLEYNGRITRSKSKKLKSKAETRTLSDANSGVVTSDIKHTIDNGKNKFVENKPKFQRLLGEMIGMYKRSKIPDDLKPPLDDIPKVTVSAQVLNDLYTISKSIQGHSYRFRTRLQIFVSIDEIDRLRPAIVQTLEKHGITQDDYDIVPPIADVSHCKKILTGARVESGNIYGSLSGFVSMQKGEQGEDLCAIASKHVLDGQRQIKLTNENIRITADVIPETAPGDGKMDFDISAAKIKAEDKMHCEGKFRSESGRLMKGMMCSYDDDQLDCQQVHFYGASTEKGQGIISMTHFNKRTENDDSNLSKEHELKSNLGNEVEDLNTRYIVVENREDDRPFCAKGDSGAMVCANDEDGNHVQLISTVIGVGGNGSCTTLRLTEAITKLETQTESRMKFLE